MGLYDLGFAWCNALGPHFPREMGLRRTDFLDRKDLATDQLLNVVYMLTGGAESTLDRKSLTELLLKSLNDTEGL